jgi:hypothetical protein
VPVTSLIENVQKSEMENILAVIAAVLVLFVATIAPYVSLGIAFILLVGPGIHEFVKKQKQEKAYSND